MIAVGKVVDGIDDPVIFRMLQAVAMPVIGSACHVFMHGLSNVKVFGVKCRIFGLIFILLLNCRNFA